MQQRSIFVARIWRILAINAQADGRMGAVQGESGRGQDEQDWEKDGQDWGNQDTDFHGRQGEEPENH